MKFITSLAFKYIRRQKLRSILTFTSITLAVFIMNIFFVFFGTIQRSLRNSEIEMAGSWEVDISPLLTPDDNLIEKYELVERNAAVSKSSFSALSAVYTNEEPEDSIQILTYEVTDDLSNSNSYVYVNSMILAGNTAISPEGSYSSRTIAAPGKNEIILPSEYSDLGYNVNDTITLSVTPLIRTIKYSSPYLRYAAAENGIDQESPNYLMTLKNMIRNAEDKDSIPFDTETYGNTVSGTFKITGFQSIPYSSSYKTLNLIEGISDSCFISDIYSANSDILEYNMKIQNVYLRIRDELNFSDSMDELVNDLTGFKESYYSLIPEEFFHTELLAYELKNYYGLTSFVPYIFIFSVIIILCWFLSRFIIDNAFEISAQERNAQFAVLRIIGSSKKQITAFTFTEAAFYSVTAIPAGTLSAILFSWLAFNSLKDYLTYIELYINPLMTAIGITLSLLAVFISSYTSALYGSRKKTLSETYYNTYLSDNIKTGKEKKTRSSMRSGRFIRRYTLKNIFRTKKRFIISSAALITGTVMLTFSGILGSVSLIESKEYLRMTEESPDFMIYAYTDSERKTIQDHLRNNPLFSDFFTITRYFMGGYSEECIKETERFLSDHGLSGFFNDFEAADERYFNKYLKDISDISYTKLASASQGIICIQGDENKCIVPDRPFTFSTDSLSVEISRIIVLKSASPAGERTFRIIIPEKTAAKLLYDRNKVMYFSIINCRISSTEKYTEAKEYIRNKIDPEDFQDNYSDSTGAMSIFFAIIKLASIFIAIIWLTGVISMTNSVNSSVLNREHELVMMRSVGMSMKQLRNTVITESIMFSSFSTIIGIITGTFLFRIVYDKPIKDAVLAVAGIMAGVIIINTAVSVLAALPGIHNLKNKLKV